MPYGNPVIAMRLLDYDSGDESEYGGTDDQLLEYLMERIVSFSFSDHDKKKDKLEMVFRNEDYKMLDKPVFVKGQKLEATWGWTGNTTAPRRMIVKKVQGGQQIMVTCQCPLSLLDTKKRSRFMAGATDSEFVRIVADEYGYRGHLANIEETTLRHDITQPRWMTDAKMCQRLARKNGFQFYIDAAGFHWHRRSTDRVPIRDFIYRQDWHEGAILAPPEFDANLTKGVSRIRVLARDPILKVPIDESVGLNDEEDVSLGSESELFDSDDDDMGLRGFRISEEEVVAGGSLTREEAKSIASGMYRDTAKKRYKCSFPIIGDPIIGAKMLIGLYGVSETFDGLYYIKEAISNIASGKYVITLELQKDALGKVKSAKKKRQNNKNEQKEEAKSDEFKKYLISDVNAKGQSVAAYIFSGDGGQTGQTSELTEEQFLALPQKTQRQLFDKGVTNYPDR